MKMMDALYVSQLIENCTTFVATITIVVFAYSATRRWAVITARFVNKQCIANFIASAITSVMMIAMWKSEIIFCNK